MANAEKHWIKFAQGVIPSIVADDGNDYTVDNDTGLMTKNDKIDEDYEAMERAEARAKEILEANNYNVQNIFCCATCKFSTRGCAEESWQCTLASQEKWNVADVDDLGVCDKYEVKE